MTETQQRFLRAIAERVPMEHVIELHLFPPIRQGGVETGVAVVAEDPRRPVPVLALADGAPMESDAAPGLEAVQAASPALENADDVNADVSLEYTEAPVSAEGDESPYAVDASF